MFCRITLGSAICRFPLLCPAGVTELKYFVVLLALPAVLFSVMGKAHWSTLAQPGLATICASSMLGVHLPVMAWLLRRGASLAGAGIDALGAWYANTGFMGIAVTVLTLGAVALPGVGLWDSRQRRVLPCVRPRPASFRSGTARPASTPFPGT